MKIVCVGDLGVDRYMPENKLLPGGITGNFTRQARRVFKPDDQIQLISAIGTDEEEAAVALAAVNQPGIESHITFYEGKTPVQYIEIHDDGEKNFTKYEKGVLENFEINAAQEELIYEADLVMTPVYHQITNVFAEVLSIQTDAIIAVDFSDFSTDPDFELLEDASEHFDIGFFGLKKSQTDLIEKLEQFALDKNILVVITLGEDGSIAFYDGAMISQDAKPVPTVIDTTGAGDAFAAGFLSRLSIDNDIQASLEKGSEIAAETIQHLGSVPE
ncbi:PfkB family carbohydrate kinase [Pseudemcibacter aquimaris]|uniref:PfkB family carbohydrate kinase n=1 Tax=Pseudemcibacter aquimaris TaxID=2857064 RepID=UPI002012839E|nr:PfkB family carbohydrate kinase [Pseudemcibacter aquimaris]MCC3860324.1 PfkB family carbohydrate kinase [Pseudemcibacter aquimaris]WDU57650.1 hypothetical protein KW060_10630 [Pseudemcibacter aquimaris]